MDFMTLLYFSAVVAATSFVFSMLGLGGGLVYLPIMYFMGFDLKTEAIPLSLALNMVTQLSASVTYWKKGLIRRDMVLPMIVAVLLVPIASVQVLLLMKDSTFIIVFAVVIFVAGVLLTCNPSWLQRKTPLRRPRLAGALIGVGGGLLAGIVGLGGGAVMVPAMMLAGLAEKEAVATSAFAVVFAALGALIGHIPTAHWHVNLLLPAATALIFSQFGSRIMAEKMGSRTIRRLFGFLVIVLSAALLIQQL
jgi:uncharacterized protein